MIVYIVEGGFDYEGYFILGVFNSYTKAVQYQIDNESKSQSRYDYIRITEWEVS